MARPFDQGVSTGVPPSADPTPIDAAWKGLVSAANEALARGDGRLATERTIAALSEAERLFREEMRMSDIVSSVSPLLLTITTQNLAELARRAGDLDRMRALLCGAFERLAAIAESPEVPHALRASAVRNFNPALAELIDALPVHLHARLVPPLIDRARAAADAVARCPSRDEPTA